MMATPSQSTPSTGNTSAPSIAARNPLPLSSAQEAQVREMYYARVRGLCAPEIKEFATCATGRTFSATWKCRTERLAMNSCMISHANQDEEDRAREEWFSGRDERRRKKEEQERMMEGRRQEVIALGEAMKQREREERQRKRSAA